MSRNVIKTVLYLTTAPFMLSPLLGSPKVGRQNDTPGVVAPAQSDRILVPAPLGAGSTCQDDMGSSLCALLFAGPDVDLFGSRTCANLIKEAGLHRYPTPEETRAAAAMLVWRSSLWAGLLPRRYVCSARRPV
jgi:hypothetical protein